MDPFSLSTGIVGLIVVALNLVVGTTGMIDKTVAAYDGAAVELKGLEKDLKQLQKEMVRIHGVLDLLASNTKDRGFKKMLRDDRCRVAIRDLCKALEATLSMLTQMTVRMNGDDLRPAPLPSDRKSLEFIRSVLKHTLTPSKITDLVKALREMRSDVQTCLTELEDTFQYVYILYNTMNNGLARIGSRASMFSTSTNLTVRIKLAAWLKGWEGTWGPFRQGESTSLHDFLQTQHVPVDENPPMIDDLDLVAGNDLDLVAGNSHFLHFEQVKGERSHMTDDLLGKMTVGLSDMTDDLLGKIFYHLCERGPLSLRHLLLASRRFSSVTVNNAHLWTTISLDVYFYHHFRQWPGQGNRFVELCLLRSRSLPLCLYIDQSHFCSLDYPFLPHPLETFGKPERNGFQRCTSLIWGSTWYGAMMTREFVDLLPKSLPSLKYMSFTNTCDPTDGFQFPNCPVLERVEMSNHQEPSPHLWGTNFQHVTALSFGSHGFVWASAVLTTLSLFPELRDLTLSIVRSMGGIYDTDPLLPVTFDNLHILRAHGPIPHEVLTKLVAPALEELHLEANFNDYTSIGTLQTSFNPLCRYIHALLPEAVSAKEPEWAPSLSKLVQKCTRIKSLYISRWMEEECKKSLSGQDVVLHVQ